MARKLGSRMISAAAGDYVGEKPKKEPEHLLGDRGAADALASLDDEYFATARAR